MDEFKMCCGTTCDKRKVQEQMRAAIADALEAEADLMLTAPQACEYDRQLVCKIGAMLKSRAALVRAGGAS